MDYEMITRIITTVGFPIVAAAALFWYVNKLTESHKEDINAMRSTIQDNTSILIELKELIKNLVRSND